MNYRFGRLLALLMALALVAAACSSDDDSSSATDSSDEDTASQSDDSGDDEEESAAGQAVLSGVLRTSDNFCASAIDKPMSELQVGFSQVESNNPWRLAETESMEQQADRVADVIITNAQGDLAKQNSDLQDLVSQGVDVILLAPREADGLDSGLEAAAEAGIPVLFVDRSHEGTPCEDFLTFMSSDFVEQGRIAAKALLDAAGDEGTIIQLEGTAGSDVAVDRKTGFDEVIDGASGWEMVASQTADFSRSEGQTVMSQLLQSHPDVSAVYAHNDEMAIGAITALEAAGRVPGEDVIVVSIDGTRDAFDAIIAGTMLMTVESNPRFGPMAFDAIEELTKGNTLPDRIVVEDRVFDASNAEELYDLGF